MRLFFCAALLCAGIASAYRAADYSYPQSVEPMIVARIGYLQEFPDYWTQGDSLEDLHAQLRELYQNLASGELPGIRRVGDIAVA